MANVATRRARVWGTMAVALALLSACSPRSAQVESTVGQPGTRQAAPTKILSVGVQREPPAFDPDLTGAAGSTTGGATSVRRIPHDDLVARTEGAGLEPRLASEMPSVEKGTWRLDSDGTMHMTWKLRPNIKWHDGVPFTSADMAFTFEVRQDPNLVLIGSGGSGRPDLMESVTTPDPQTFVVRWKAPYTRADLGGGLTPLPKHLIEDLYRSKDVEALTTSRLLTTEFVGLGAYRLVHWEQGSHMEFAGFQDYYLGRPGFDRLFVRFIPDVNTLVANILSETIDVVLPPTVDMETALEVRRRWEGTGNQVRVDVGSELKQLDLQHRPAYARPREGLTNRAVRQAFYHAIDRHTLTEIMTQGLAPTADSWYQPNHPLRKDLEAFIPQFPHDPNRALQLLAQAGWVRGGDGVLAHQTTGERFEVTIMHRSGSGPEKEANIIADGWKAAGALVGFSPLTQQQANDSEHLGTRTGPYLTAPTGEGFSDSRLHSSQAGRPETRWTGPNRGGYSNPLVDAVLDKLVVTIDPQEQLALHRQLLHEQMADIALMPLYWEVSPILMLKGVTGPRMAYNVTTYNMGQWDRV